MFRGKWTADTEGVTSGCQRDLAYEREMLPEEREKEETSKYESPYALGSCVLRNARGASDKMRTDARAHVIA